MKTAFILAFILLLLSFHSNAQQTIDKLNVNQLKLPKESTNKALILDGAGQVKSSSTITDTELGYLEGLSDTLVNLLSGKANDSDVVKLSGNQSVDGVKTFTGKLVASSTVNGSIPCPVMTEAQRDLFTPVEGDCVYNSDTLKLNVFDGSVWKDVGGAGGISLWLTANPYNINDIVIESDKIYRCLIAHTSGVFATDLGAGNWGEVSQGLTSPVALADGGTGLSITPVSGSIVYVDADSFEQLAPGSAGQILQSNGSSAPSWVNKSIAMFSENSYSSNVEEIQVPNNLLTETDLNKKLIETGNNNILENPSFESISIGSGWTNSAGALSFDYSVLIHGKRSAKLVLSSETMSLTQSSTLYASQFADGVQGLASVRVKSDVALKVCALQAGVVSTSLCVDVQANNKWGLYKVPFILGATSNGISIASTGAVSGTVYIDDAFVGASSLTQNMNACNDVSCETEFSASVSSTGVVSNENLDWINGNVSSINNAVYTLNYNSNLFTITPNCYAEIVRVNTSSTAYCRVTNSTTNSQLQVRCENSATGADLLADFNIICQKQGADFTAAKQLSNGNTYSSTNSDTDWASCGHTAASFTGLGSVTNISTQCKRQGSDLLMKGRFTVGIPTAVEARLALPTWNGVQLTSAGSSVIPSLQLSGDMIYSASSTLYYRHATLIEPSVSYMTFGNQASTNAAYQKITGIVMSGNNQNFSFSSRIPIEGWQNSNIIIGQFNGLESCTNTLECTDTFSAKISAAGVVSGENVDWINGNCSYTSGVASCTFNSSVFTVAPNCIATSLVSGNTATTMQNSAPTSSGFAFLTRDSASGAAINRDIHVICQKQGVDYIGKTAKAVASDQNVRSQGLTRAVINSCEWTSAGAFNNSIMCNAGFSSMSKPATGRYQLNFKSTQANNPVCTTSNLNVGADRMCNIYSISTSAVTVQCENSSAGADLDVPGLVICHGVE